MYTLDKLKDFMLNGVEEMIALNDIACFLEEVLEYKPELNSKVESKTKFLKDSLEDGSLPQAQYDEELQHINNFISEIGSLVDSLSGDMSVGKGNVIPTVDTELWLGRIKQFLES
jgi:hypothetical protein